ncbi:hypothetical protein GGR51DRAFT_545172 [Nemania sp. FL0031]|nr:hypothetical protein GGR51DRAFT_545172 [Nemania sp. FL0031]
MQPGLKGKSSGLPYNTYWTASLEDRLFSFWERWCGSYAIRGQTLYPKLLLFIMCFVRIIVSSWILLYFTFVIGDPSLGIIRSYSDSSCLKQVNKTQGVAAGACVNTDSVVAVAADSLPSCGRTTAILYISDIANCMDPSFLPIVSSGNVGDCLSFIEGRPIDSAHFQCKNSTDETGNTPDNTTGSPPEDPPEGGDLSLGTILGLVFGLISAIGTVIGVVMRFVVCRRSERPPSYY